MLSVSNVNTEVTKEKSKTRHYLGQSGNYKEKEEYNTWGPPEDREANILLNLFLPKCPENHDKTM